MCDAAAARPDFNQVDGGNENRQAAAFRKTLLACSFEAEGNRGFAILDQASFGRGAAHIESKQVALLVAQAMVRGGTGARRWAGFKPLDGYGLGFGAQGQYPDGQHPV